MARGVSRSNWAGGGPVLTAPAGHLDQPPEIGVQQVGVVAQQVVDQPSRGRVAGQRAQQVIRGVLPPAPPAMSQ